MTPREQALYLLAGKIPPGPAFFEVAAQALAVRTGCRWAGIGELSPAGDSVTLLAFWDRDHHAEPFSFQLEGSPCLEVYRSRPDDPHKFFSAGVANRFCDFPMLAQIGARSYRGEVFHDDDDRPVGHVFVISEHDEEDSPDVRDFFRLVAQRAGAEYNRWKLSGVVAERTAQVAERDRLLRELEASKAEVEAKNVEMERFTHAVSHDLRSPLMTITGFLGILEQDLATGDHDRVRDDVRKIKTAAARMEQLTDELATLAHIGRVVASPEEVGLEALAREAVEVVEGRIAERGVTVEIAADLPVVVGDRPRLLQLLQNLVENAVKFMGDQPEPRIEIAARRDGDQTVCCVRDNGTGIDPGDHEKVFGLFERLDPKSEGTGTGLALVRRIVEVHGGRVWVESEGTGKGCTFCFVLPLEAAGP